MTAGHGAKRPQRQDVAIAALLTEPTLEAAARRAGVSESSLLRWLRDPAFRAEYRAARRAVVEQAVSGLQHATSEAVAALTAYAFANLHAVRVEIITDAENDASRRVAERCQFVLEGTLRNERRAPDGHLRSTCIYARLAPAS